MHTKFHAMKITKLFFTICKKLMDGLNFSGTDRCWWLEHSFNCIRVQWLLPTNTGSISLCLDRKGSLALSNIKLCCYVGSIYPFFGPRHFAKAFQQWMRMALLEKTTFRCRYTKTPFFMQAFSSSFHLSWGPIESVELQVEKGSMWMECTIPKKRVAILQNFWKVWWLSP